MGAHSRQGFTIIETMLVLAITGALVMAFVMGVGTAINNQRYRDSVITFQALLQDQYSAIDNVRNDRDASWSCGSSAQPGQGGSATIAPGQSDCVLLGRYVSVVGSAITMATVVGYQTANGSENSDIATVRANYTLGVSQNSVERDVLDWGAEIHWAPEGTDSQPGGGVRSISLLFVRSPETGSTYTFTSDSVRDVENMSDEALKEMMIVGESVPGQQARTICIEPSGVAIPEKMALFIAAGANGSGSIETRSYSTIVSLGGDTEC
jgi:prepilin-type N-terminal cleavage/methylation domain-containing protein